MNTLYAETDQALNAIRRNTNAGGMVVQEVDWSLPWSRCGEPKEEGGFWMSQITGVSVRTGYRYEHTRVWSTRPMRQGYVVEVHKNGTDIWSETEESAR